MIDIDKTNSPSEAPEWLHDARKEFKHATEHFNPEETTPEIKHLFWHWYLQGFVHGKKWKGSQSILDLSGLRRTS